MQSESSKPSIFDQANKRGEDLHDQEKERRTSEKEAEKEWREEQRNAKADAKEHAAELAQKLQSFFEELKKGGVSTQTRIVKNLAFDVGLMHNGEPISFGDRNHRDKDDNTYYKKVVALEIAIKSKETTRKLVLNIIPSRRTQWNSDFFYQVCRDFPGLPGEFYVSDFGDDAEECQAKLRDEVVEYLADIKARKLARKKPKKPKKETSSKPRFHDTKTQRQSQRALERMEEQSNGRGGDA